MKRLAAIAGLVWTASVSVAPLCGQGGQEAALTLVGRGRVSAIYDIEAVSPYAYALERGMLRVLDVRNPAAIREVASLGFEGARSRTALRYPYLYLSGSNQPLAVIDISRPTRPRWVAACADLPGANGDVFELAGEKAYLVRQEARDGAAGRLFLDVLDVSTSEGCPRKLGSVDLGVGVAMGSEYGGIAQANQRAFVMVQRPAGVPNRSEMVIVDATSSEAPRVARTVLLPPGKQYHDLEVRDDLLFLLDSTPQKPNGLAIYRLPAQGDPELIGEALSPDIFFPIDLIAHGNVVYGTFKGGSLLVTFDVSNPASPRIADRYRQTDRWSAGLGMALAGNRLYVTGDNGPAPIFDISTAAAPHLLGRWEYQGGAIDGVALDGTLAVLRGIGGDLFFYDVANPRDPKRIGIHHGVSPSSEFQWNVAVGVRGPRALIAYESSPAHLLDITHPARPVVLATFMPRGLVQAVALTSTDAFLGYRAGADGKTPRAMDPSSVDGRGGIESIDLRDPRALRSVATLDLDAVVTDLAVAGDRLVAGHADGSLTVVDVHDPGRLAVLGRLPGGASTPERSVACATRVALSADGRLAFVGSTDPTSGAGLVSVVDLRDPAIPRRVGDLNVGRAGRAELRLAVDGNRIAVLLAGKDVVMVDASDATHLRSTARFSLPVADAQGLAFRNGTVFVAAGEDGLLIYRLTAAPTAVNSRRP